jgi:hypothetical protein
MLWLLGLNADVDARSKRSLRSALHMACEEGRSESVGILLEAAADVKALHAADSLHPD